MIINNKHVQGIFLYSPDVEYEKGDFVVSGDSIYICTAANPTNPDTFTVMGVNPETDSTGNYKVYPGDKISTVQEYYDYVNNRMYWNYKDTKEEVENALGVEAGGLIVLGSFSNRSDLPVIKKEGDVYRVGTASTGYEYAYIPYKEDKYISGSVLNQILQDAYFGVNESGVITNHVYTEIDDSGVLHLDYSIGGTLANIEDNKILNAIMKSPDLNNGMFNVSRSLPELSGFINLESTVETVLVRQYTYADNKLGNTRIRIQELIDPESSIVYYRWSSGIGVSSNPYDLNRPYHLNDVVVYNGQAWLSMEDNNTGHTPGTDEAWWIEFPGEWSYENITAWTSSFSAGASRISAQLDSIKAFYTKKIAELEATKKQLTGAFCNREAQRRDEDTDTTRTLVARANVKMNSSWRFIEGDEEDLLQNLQVSSLSDIFTLFSSTSQVDNLLNTSNLTEITVVVKVGTSNNFTYSYSQNGAPWQHGNTMTNLLTNLNVDSISSIFEVDSITYTNYPLLEHPDFPFTVILKDKSTGEMKVSLYEPYNGTWNLTGKTLFDQSEIDQRLSTIYYEDLAWNDEIVGVASSGSNDVVVGNTAVIRIAAANATTQVTGIPLPTILPVFNSSNPFLFKPSFVEPLIGASIPDYVSSAPYRFGDRAKSNGVVYIVVSTSTSGITGDDPVTNSNNNWMEYDSYIGLYNSWRSYYGTSDNEDSTVSNIYDLLTKPYIFNQSFWGSLIFGPSPKIASSRSDDHINVIYPASTIIVDNSGTRLGKTPRTISGNDSRFDTDLFIYSDSIRPNDKYFNYLPDYNSLFSVSEFEDALGSGNDILVLPIKLQVQSPYLAQNNGSKHATGFFCIMYPVFEVDNNYCRIYYNSSDHAVETDTTDLFILDNAYYCFLDFSTKLAYLRSVNLYQGSRTEDIEKCSEISREFMEYIKNLYPDPVNAIGTYIDNASINNSLNGNFRISSLGSLTKLNVFFKLGYRGGTNSRSNDLGNPVSYTCSAYSSTSFSSITQGRPDHTNITYSNDTSLPGSLGICTLITSSLKGDLINTIVRIGSHQYKDYEYYISNSGLSDYLISALPSGSRTIGDPVRGLSNFYTPGTTYSIGDTVIYCDQVWSAISQSNEAPYPGSSKWEVVEDTGSSLIKYRSGRIDQSGLNYYKVRSAFTGKLRNGVIYRAGDIVIDGNVFKIYDPANNPPFVVLSQQPGATKINDTRFNVVLNNQNIQIFPIESDTPAVLSKVLLSLKTGFSYIIDSNGYQVVKGGIVSSMSESTITPETILKYATPVSNSSIIQETNNFYVPPTIVKDISSDPNYEAEYKIMYNTPSTRKTTSDWVIGAGPVDRLLEELTPSGESTINCLLEGLTVIDSTTIVNYSIPIRTVCIDEDSVELASKKYFVNGNYWVRGSHPANDSEYIKWNDNTSTLGPLPSSFIDLPDAFSMGKIYVVFGIGSQSEEWYVVQNPDWLTIDLENGGFYDKNRRATIKRWWNNTSRDYSCSEEALFDILHTNFVINTSGTVTLSNPKYKGILWDSGFNYFSGDIVIYHGTEYDPSQTYTAGKVVVYGGELWKSNTGGITGAWDETKWDDLGVSDFSLWKCTTNNVQIGEVPGSTSSWAVYGDPLYNTLSFVPSKTVLLSNVNPSVPFNLVAKIGSSSKYSIAVNSQMTDFDTTCIATVLIKTDESNSLIHFYPVTIDLYLGSDTSASYYVTDSIVLTVSIPSGSDSSKTRELTVTGGTNTTIKNIYYRYTL